MDTDGDHDDGKPASAPLGAGRPSHEPARRACPLSGRQRLPHSWDRCPVDDRYGGVQGLYSYVQPRCAGPLSARCRWRHRHGDLGALPVGRQLCLDTAGGGPAPAGNAPIGFAAQLLARRVPLPAGSWSAPHRGMHAPRHTSLPAGAANARLPEAARLAIVLALWPPARSPFAVPLFAELIALSNEPFIAARSVTVHHLAIELQALQAFFHLCDSAHRLRAFPTVVRQLGQLRPMLLQTRSQPIDGTGRLFDEEIGRSDHGATFRLAWPVTGQ